MGAYSGGGVGILTAGHQQPGELEEPVSQPTEEHDFLVAELLDHEGGDEGGYSERSVYAE